MAPVGSLLAALLPVLLPVVVAGAGVDFAAGWRAGAGASGAGLALGALEVLGDGAAVELGAPAADVCAALRLTPPW